ncbi:MAG: hypothetical protein JJD93_11575, partial [Ilumatobacteraceae bacterium]|nr:hypothetical protein [Ilumatobacteraceae bacterium]
MIRITSRTRRFTTTTVVAFAAVLAVGTAAAVAKFDSGFGVERDNELAKDSEKLFGVGKPIAESSSASITQAAAQADPTKLVTLARKLKVRVVTTQGP